MYVFGQLGKFPKKKIILNIYRQSAFVSQCILTIHQYRMYNTNRMLLPSQFNFTTQHVARSPLKLYFYLFFVFKQPPILRERTPKTGNLSGQPASLWAAGQEALQHIRYSKHMTVKLKIHSWHHSRPRIDLGGGQDGWSRCNRIFFVLCFHTYQTLQLWKTCPVGSICATSIICTGQSLGKD